MKKKIEISFEAGLLFFAKSILNLFCKTLLNNNI